MSGVSLQSFLQLLINAVAVCTTIQIRLSNFAVAASTLVAPLNHPALKVRPNDQHHHGQYTKHQPSGHLIRQVSTVALRLQPGSVVVEELPVEKWWHFGDRCVDAEFVYVLQFPPNDLHLFVRPVQQVNESHRYVGEILLTRTVGVAETVDVRDSRDVPAEAVRYADCSNDSWNFQGDVVGIASQVVVHCE
ncbi:hypothetical protein HDK64DRAFT_275007 [Phyllosticta capitalensis]